MRFRDDVVLTLALVAALASGSSATVAAGTETFRGSYDPASPVGSECSPIPEVDPAPRVDDLTVRHDADRVTVTVEVSGLAAADSAHVTIPVATPSGRWELDEGPWEGRVMVTRPTPPPTDVSEAGCAIAISADVPSPCRGSSLAVDRRAERVTVSVPRRCLRDPGWVRAGALVSVFDGEAVGSAVYDPESTGVEDWFAPVLGPRVPVSP